VCTYHFKYQILYFYNSPLAASLESTEFTFLALVFITEPLSKAVAVCVELSLNCLGTTGTAGLWTVKVSVLRRLGEPTLRRMLAFDSVVVEASTGSDCYYEQNNRVIFI